MMLTWAALEKIEGDNNISLKLLSAEHIPELIALASDARIWKYQADRLENPDVFQVKWINNAIQQIQKYQRVCFVIYSGDKIVGSSSFYDIDEANKTLVIGYTWYHPDCWGKKINRTVKLMMLGYVFDELNFNRAAFMVDSINTHSLNSLKKFGAQYEGVLRNHMVLSDGRIRHTVVLSVIKEEWSGVKSLLQDVIG